MEPRKKYSQEDKIALRTKVQEQVHEFIVLRRRRLHEMIKVKEPTLTDDEIREQVDLLQPSQDEYDPVVELALVGADHSHDVTIRVQANSRVAEYLHPKLKSVEHIESPEKREEMDKRNELATEIMHYLRNGKNTQSSAQFVVPDPEPGEEPPEEEDF